MVGVPKVAAAPQGSNDNQVLRGGREEERVADDVTGREDLFYQGVILRLYPGRKCGVIRTGNGREVPFSFATVDLLGDDQRFDQLYEGMPVGFDLTRTSGGLRITKIKVYRRR